MRDNRGFIEALVGDGRPLLAFTGLSLILSGLFALFLSLTGQFLPHDIAFLGMTAQELCAYSDCRVVHFMIHDRAAFGGALVAIGVLYLWLTTFPLRAGERWAWWALLVSGLAGFSSFLSYVGYGYLDTWHGAATLILLPIFSAGLAKSRSLVEPLQFRGGDSAIEARTARVGRRDRREAEDDGTGGWFTRTGPPSRYGLRADGRVDGPYLIGKVLLLATAAGLLGAGITIITIGTNIVFVPQDLEFMGMHTSDLHTISPRLIPLIAHDRAGFGGAILSTGIAVLFCVWYGRPSRNLWQALAAAGLFGFGCAIGIHLAVGYVDFIHLLPAYAGLLTFSMGLLLSHNVMMQGQDASVRPEPVLLPES